MSCVKALRDGTLAGKFTPIFCGSSKNFHGVQLLLDAVVDYLPSPADRPPVEGVHPEDQGESRAQARTRRSRSRAWRSRRSPRRPATWSTCASTPASCIPRMTVMNTTVGKDRAHRPHLSA